MRHGLHLSKLSRTTSHRMLMLRNLVSSLLLHQQVSTTLPKAKAAQKLADQVIQWGKLGGKDNWDRTNAFLLNSRETLTPLFTTFAQRYAQRPGGYTRILRSGYRVGDNAPLAVLELVDNQNDLRFETSAKTVARELAVRTRTRQLGPEAFKQFRTRVERDGPDLVVGHLSRADELGPVTKKNVEKALRFRRNETSPLPVDSHSTTKPLSTLPPADPTATATSSDAAVKLVHPSTLFLDRVYHHYLASLAQFSLASPSPSPLDPAESSRPSLSQLYHPDPQRTISQLSQRLHPRESKPAPKPVSTVPMTGKKFLAGERTDGYYLVEGNQEQAGGGGGRVVEGGPISRAKGDWSKRGLDRKRRVPVHATDAMDRLEEELAQRL